MQFRDKLPKSPPPFAFDPKASVLTPVGAKTLTLPVTTVTPCRSAQAPIIRSARAWLILAESAPQIRASSALNGNNRSENSKTVRSSQPLRSRAKAGSRPSCWRIPRSILPMVITLRKDPARISHAVRPQPAAHGRGGTQRKSCWYPEHTSKGYVPRPDLDPLNFPAGKGHQMICETFPRPDSASKQTVVFFRRQNHQSRPPTPCHLLRGPVRAASTAALNLSFAS